MNEREEEGGGLKKRVKIYAPASLFKSSHPEIGNRNRCARVLQLNRRKRYCAPRSVVGRSEPRRSHRSRSAPPGEGGIWIRVTLYVYMWPSYSAGCGITVNRLLLSALPIWSHDYLFCFTHTHTFFPHSKFINLGRETSYWASISPGWITATPRNDFFFFLSSQSVWARVICVNFL